MMRTLETALLSLLLVAACDDSSDDPKDSSGETAGSASATDGSGSTTASSDGSDGSASTTTGTSTTGNDSGESTTTSGSSESDSEGTGGSSGGGTGSGGEADVWDPEFAWVADFIREKCVACHNMGQNGNIVFPSVDMTNQQVMESLDGGTATTGNLFIEPGNAADSQVYIMITNAAGEQFPMETTDRVAAWINSGAPYYAQ